MARLESYAGGVTGVGGTVALRQTMDKKGGLLGDPGSLLDRLTRPSVIYGVGTGALAGGLYWMDENRRADTTPFGIDNTFWGTHALTGVTSGTVSALLPATVSPDGTNGGTQTVTRDRTMTRKDQKPAGGSEPEDAGGSGNPDFEPAT